MWEKLDYAEGSAGVTGNSLWGVCGPAGLYLLAFLVPRNENVNVFGPPWINSASGFGPPLWNWSANYNISN